jgi:tRNA(fMet)-specific endonuclease VapC
MIVADTDVLVDYLRDAGAAARVELELASGKLATTVVAAFELTQGARTAADEETIATLLSALTLIPLSAESARRAGQLRRDLRRQRQDIGVADCLVAGICLTQKLTHQVLADLAGAHRATVTTLLNDWLYDGVLATTPDGCLALRRPRDLWTLAGYATPAEAAAPAPAPR